MSKIFGPFIQQGYIVPDLAAGIAHWVDRGVGPFLVIPEVRIEGEHYGKLTLTVISAAFAMSGDQQIELIQPLADTGPNIYSDYLEKFPEGGLQHLAVWSDDVAGQLETLKAQGVDYVLAQRHYGTHAYLDFENSPGPMVQLMPSHQRYLDLFRIAQEEADSWDGMTASRIMEWDD